MLDEQAKEKAERLEKAKKRQEMLAIDHAPKRRKMISRN
jgi:hypothetical protein